ncbi:hypothetical protein [Micromonospora purpureochromogenes]|uniref:Uncharacterized protein n=1 Tax=Micromonospora purpureochromogenes TaxID=47872 RepID=A0ABX2RH14_9ACTN|nr:hypothetical protein [Micromonospora purpureochromogenes]NYF54717.1 hypothetical protein [Micromonospora purpureochromogenes]
MPQPQPGADRPADGSPPVTDVGREPAVADEPTPSPVPADAGPHTGPEGTRELPADRATAPGDPERTAAEPATTSPDEPTAPTSPAPPAEGRATDGPDQAPVEAAPTDDAPPPTRIDTAPPAGVDARAPGAAEPTRLDTGAPEAPHPTRVDAGLPTATPQPTRVDTGAPATPEPTRVEPEPPAPRWTGSAAVPPPPPRRRVWGESAEPTPVPPTPVELPEHRTPVDPWAGADTGSWELEHHHLPALPPTLPYPTPPVTRPYEATPPATRPYEAAPPPSRPYPPPAAHPVSPPPVAPPRPAPPPPPPPPAPPKQRRGRRPKAVTPPPGWEAPRGYVPVPVRRRRRWPWVLLLSLVCCCGCPAWFGKPMWEQYPANAALPGQVADLTLRQDAGSQATAKRLKAEVRAANLLSEDVFAGVYGTGDGKRVTVFGGTGFRFNPESDADDEMTRLTETYRLDAPQAVETRVRGRYERCATGRSDGTDVVVCTSVDYGSITTAVFTRLSVDDSARLLDTLREQIVTPAPAQP